MGAFGFAGNGGNLLGYSTTSAESDNKVYAPQIIEAKDRQKLIVDNRVDRNWLSVYHQNLGNKDFYIQYRFFKSNSAISLNLWKLVDINVVTRVNTSYRFNYVASLVSAGESDVVWFESMGASNTSIDYPAQTVSGVGGAGDPFFGGTAHGNEYPMNFNASVGTTDPLILVDGYPMDATISGHYECNRFQLLQKSGLCRPRNPVITTPYVIEQMREWIITPGKYEFRLNAKFNETFTGGGYLPLVCTQELYTTYWRDSDNLRMVLPTDPNTTPALADSEGVTRVIMGSPTYGGVTINMHPIKQYAAGDKPNGPLRIPGHDLSTIRVTGGYHKNYRSIGAQTAGTGSFPWRSAANEEWVSGYDMEFRV